MGSFGSLPGVLFWIAPAGALLALAMAYVFFQLMIRSNPGSARMIEIAGHVKEGAMAYLYQQYKVVGAVFVVLFVLLGLMALAGLQSPLVPVAFLTGGFFSGLCGFLGMKTATSASNRTAQGAKESLDRGLKVAFRSGAVMGFVVVGFALVDICAWFWILRYLAVHNVNAAGDVIVFGINLGHLSLEEITVIMLNFGMGASTQALFARVGGGIFTKAADVGADLVGKVEAGIPEDDPRNPATIADNVGDNVGDVAGMGADLYESYAGSVLATAALGAAAFRGNPNLQIASVITPMVVAGIGTISSVIGCFLVRAKEGASQKQLMAALFRGINGASILTIIGAAVTVKILMPGHFGLWFSILSGLCAGIWIAKATEYYTSDDYRPTQWLATQCKTGPATTIIGGMAVGMESVMQPVIAIGLGTILAFAFAGGFSEFSMGLYGVGIAAVGMLSTLGITLATDAYGPIADNAGGNAQMTEQEPIVRERTDALDSLGNTTAATGKGFAIGSAALTALALLAAYIEEIRVALIRVARAGDGTVLVGYGDHARQIGIEAIRHLSLPQFMEFYQVHLMNPNVLIGLFLGSMMAFYFCALTMKAVGRAAGQMVEEVRNQFREKKGIMEGREKPDYARCVSISTQAAQKEMVFPSLLAIICPIIVGILFDVSGVVGLLSGALSAGFVLAVMMANSGGSWDNAKKFIEKGNYGGKGSEAHKAGVVGDTVGDPFKDTSGPSLNILIKLMSMVSIVSCGIVAKYPPIVKILGDNLDRILRSFGS
ncbi:MAG: sodium-translocating pyrophosphatase [Candidatus Hydrogenedentota bacterium]|nr:MAG: sodium-translocating pyrophosphatase [Candidatus Hydrogenedentota bacterium]